MECTSPALGLWSHLRLRTPPHFSSSLPRGFVKSLEPFLFAPAPWRAQINYFWRLRPNSRRLKERKTVWLSLPLSFPSLTHYRASIWTLSLHVFLSPGIASSTRCSPVNWPGLQHANRDPAEAPGATDTKSVALHTHERWAFLMLSKHGTYFGHRMYHRVAGQELP